MGQILWMECCRYLIVTDLKSILLLLLMQALNVCAFHGKIVTALSTKCISIDVDSKVTKRATAVLDTLSMARWVWCGHILGFALTTSTLSIATERLYISADRLGSSRKDTYWSGGSVPWRLATMNDADGSLIGTRQTWSKACDSTLTDASQLFWASEGCNAL